MAFLTLSSSGWGRNPKFDFAGKQVILRQRSLVNDLISHLETTIFWYDNPGGECHIVNGDLFCSHNLQLADFTGNGQLDIFVDEMGLGENKLPTYRLQQLERWNVRAKRHCA